MRIVSVVAILIFVFTACAGPAAPTAAKAAPTAAAAAQPAAKPTAPPAAPTAGQTTPAAKPAAQATAQPSGQAQFVFRLAFASSVDNPNGVMSAAFKQEVEKTSNGRISIQLFPNSQLGSEAETVNALKAGTLDMVAPTAAAVGSLSPSMQITDLPFFYTNMDDVHRVLDSDAGSMALATLEKAGVKGLAWGDDGFRGVLNARKPINSVADVKGLKLRVTENPLYVATWKTVGANPVPMAWTEVYNALQQKTVDGVDTAYFAMIDSKLYEVAKNLALTSHIWTAVLLVMNKSKYDALPADLKKVVEDAAHVGALATRKVAQAHYDLATDTMKKQGVTITTPPRDAFKTEMKGVYDEFVPKIGADIVAKAQAALGAR